MSSPIRFEEPFSSRNRLSPKEKAAVRRELADKGIRRLPYPFGSGVAIVSDLDASNRDRYAAYVQQLVGDLGLDFGDSTWFHWRHSEDRQVASGFGFLSPHFSVGGVEMSSVYQSTRTFLESLAEFHLGNVDHLHSLVPRGPQVVILDSPEVRDGRAESTLR